MPGIRTPKGTHTFFNAKAATGAGTAMRVSDFNHITVFIATDGGGDANLTVKCQGSVEEDAPTWASAQSVTNMWDFIAMTDLEDLSQTDGDTGFVVAGADDYHIYNVNVEGLNWLNFRVTARAEGEVTVIGRQFTNQ